MIGPQISLNNATHKFVSIILPSLLKRENARMRLGLCKVGITDNFKSPTSSTRFPLCQRGKRNRIRLGLCKKIRDLLC